MLGAVPMMEARHAPLGTMGVDNSYTGAGGYDQNNNQPMGFNPSETPAPYGGHAISPAPYDPHLQPAHLHPQDTGVSSLGSGSYAGGDGFVSAQSTGYGQGGVSGGGSPYDPHYSQHQEYNELPAAGAGYSGSARFS
ncbi:hypothetical protein AA313_de0204138 [Arthrobotrys entomopaga]|nr:hypothetical protein AA313_de0204138 [Arthrobotrys entomopaga]